MHDISFVNCLFYLLIFALSALPYKMLLKNADCCPYDFNTVILMHHASHKYCLL